jgi:rod shape determining protein RodA
MATKRFPIDWPLVIVALLLSIYGIAIVYSAGQTDIPTAVARLWKTQLVWFSLAVVAAYGVSRCSVRLIDWLTWPAYFLSVAMLVLLLFVGKGAGTAASSKSWLAIGGFRIGQPSELA